jgi:hypothetical protein
MMVPDIPQALQVVWFWMIVRVAYRVVTGSGAADERSDEEVDRYVRLTLTHPRKLTARL